MTVSLKKNTCSFHFRKIIVKVTQGSLCCHLMARQSKYHIAVFVIGNARVSGQTHCDNTCMNKMRVENLSKVLHIAKNAANAAVRF